LTASLTIIFIPIFIFSLIFLFSKKEDLFKYWKRFTFIYLFIYLFFFWKKQMEEILILGAVLLHGFYPSVILSSPSSSVSSKNGNLYAPRKESTLLHGLDGSSSFVPFLQDLL